MTSTMRIPAIDGLRAAAVLMVVGYHAGALPAVMGDRAVDLFFVLSGLCLALPFLAERRPIVASRFWLSRLTRIGPPYWIALTIFAVTASIPLLRLAISPPPHEVLGEYLNNLVFNTGMATHLNGPYWTLGVEARWYVVFPFVLALYMRSRVLFGLAMLALYAWYVSPWRVPDAGMLPCFMLGIVAADLLLHEKVQSWIYAVLALVAVAVAVYVDRGQDHGDPFWHVAAFLVVLAGIGVAARVASWRPLVFLGAASYSIYLIHSPPLYWMRHGLHVPAPLAAVLSLALGIAFWAAVEAPLLRLRAGAKSSPTRAPDTVRAASAAG